MNVAVLFLVIGTSFAAIGQCVESEYRVPISERAFRENETLITNIVFNVLSDGDGDVVSLTPSLRSCIKFVGNGEAHFVDLTCEFYYIGLFDAIKPLRKGCFCITKFLRIGKGHVTEADCCGGGPLQFRLDDVSRDEAGTTQVPQKVAGSERPAENRQEKCFLSSGVRRLTPYLENGTLRTYLKTSFDRENWFVVSYVLWIEDDDEKTGQKLSFDYDIVRISEKGLSSVRKGVLPISVQDKSASHADGVRIAITEYAKWNYELDVGFEGIGCQIRIRQRSINEELEAWNIEATRMSNRD